MATFTGSRAAGSFPAPSIGHATAGLDIWGFINVAANPADGDLYKLAKIPARTIIFGGWFAGDDIDTGTEAMDIDLGWAANGLTSAETIKLSDGDTHTDVGNAASVAGFVNSGVLSGDGITDLTAAGKFWRPIFFGKPIYFGAETTIQAEANAAANALTAGNLMVWLRGQVVG